GLLRERVALLWVPDDDVAVGADGERALPRVEPEDLRRRGRGDLDEAVHRDPAGAHALPEEVEPRLDARHAVRDLGEVVPPELLLVLHAERAVVGRDDLELVVAQAPPEVLVVVLRTERRGADELRPFKVRPGE